MASTPNPAAELARLRAENEKLREALKAVGAALSKSEWQRKQHKSVLDIVARALLRGGVGLEIEEAGE